MFGLRKLAPRALNHSSRRSIIYWRPRWANERSGYFFGSGSARKYMIEHGDSFIFIVAGFITLHYQIFKHFFMESNDNEHRHLRMNGQNAHGNGYFPRPVRQSELDDPMSPWHTFRDHFGKDNLVAPACHEPMSDLCFNHYKIFWTSRP